MAPATNFAPTAHLSNWTPASECGPDEFAASCTNTKGQTALGCRKKAYRYEPGSSCKGMRFLFPVRAEMPTTQGPPTPIRPEADTKPLGPTGPIIETNRRKTVGGGGTVPIQTQRSMGLDFGGILRGVGGFAKDLIPGNIDDMIIDRLPGMKPPTGFAPTTCPPGFSSTPGGGCSPTQSYGPVTFGDPTPGVATPAEASMGVGGLRAPMLMNVNRLKCPGGGVVHFYPNTATYSEGKLVDAQFACLPRGVSGAKFGLVRKNKARPKPYVSAHDARMLKKYGKGGSMGKKAKAFAKLTGQSCSSSRGR